MKKHKNIRRIDNDKNRTHAWLVQVQRNNKIVIKMFSDGVFDGKQKALNAAIKFKTGVLAGISEYKYYIRIRSKVRKNNRSGIAGVARYESVQNVKTGRKAAFWTAFWDDENGKRRSRKFYVSCYGEHEAKRLAVLKRKEMTKEVCAAKCISKPLQRKKIS